MILPSLLEYDIQVLEDKLLKVKQDLENFQIKTKAKDERIVSLHLDFVLPQFADSRNVKPSLSPVIVLESLYKHFSSDYLDLSIHLMGNKVDILQVSDFFKGYEYNNKWGYLILLPKDIWLKPGESMTDQNSDYNINSKYFKTENADNIGYGIWLDPEEWTNHNFETYPQVRDYLLMSVIAGKSGQKRTSEITTKILETVKKYPTKKFILDGGWQIDNLPELKNADYVSYSSFWKVF